MTKMDVVYVVAIAGRASRDQWVAVAVAVAVAIKHSPLISSRKTGL